MNFFYNTLLNFIIILFPFFIYLILKIYYPNKEKLIFFISSFLSFILFFLYVEPTFIEASFFIIIPLIFNYIYNNKKMSILISIILIIIYKNIFKVSIYVLILEYMIYFVMNIYINKNTNKTKEYINKFIIVRSFFLSFYIFQKYIENGLNNNLIYITISIILLYLVSYIFYFIINNSISINEYQQIKKKIDSQENLKNYLCAITHELKNSLAITKGYLDIMKNKNKEEYLQIIRKEVNRSINIIQDGLNISKDKLNYEILDINLLLEDITNTLELLFKKKRIKYKINYLDNDTFILGDYEKLKQVIINIIKNSMESKDKNLEIDISIYIYKEDVCIAIKDNGIGIDDINKIGKNFSNKISGSGIGTFFSKSIIEKHQGELIYESEKNLGTIVKILLPIFK